MNKSGGRVTKRVSEAVAVGIDPSIKEIRGSIRWRMHPPSRGLYAEAVESCFLSLS